MRKFFQIWNKRPLGFKDEPTRFWRSKVDVKGQGQRGQMASHACEHTISRETWFVMSAQTVS